MNAEDLDQLEAMCSRLIIHYHRGSVERAIFKRLPELIRLARLGLAVDHKEKRRAASTIGKLLDAPKPPQSVLDALAAAAEIHEQEPIQENEP